MPALVALAALALAAPGAAAQPPSYTLVATQSCLTRLPNSVAGLPPARPPVPPALFVLALARDAVSTGGVGRRPLPHEQLGVWSGGRSYQGIILSFSRAFQTRAPR